MTEAQRVGVVIIGRNEGQALIRSLESLCTQSDALIYVDSGSTDNSIAEAESRGVHVVSLDTSRPFTAARARNAGFDELMAKHPDVTTVQFVDGDCEVFPGWIDAAVSALTADPARVAVCGWGNERHPEKSIFNRILHIEWRMGATGDVPTFCGRVMVKATAFAEVNGFDGSIIAGEEGELAERLRAKGGKIWKLDQDCFLHDVGMMDLRQWWKRAVRSGYAYVHVAHLTSTTPNKQLEVQRIIRWGIIAPIAGLLLAPFTRWLSLLTFAKYPISAYRAGREQSKRGASMTDSIAWGISCALSVFPQAVGMFRYHRTIRKNGQH
jgi:GT2 family glycosyltransferase